LNLLELAAGRARTRQRHDSTWLWCRGRRSNRGSAAVAGEPDAAAMGRTTSGAW